MNKQALDHSQHVFNPIRGLPVLLERVDADGAVACDVGVEDLGQEERLGWVGWE